MERNMFCPACGYSRLTHLPVNDPVGDFICDGCGAEFELKSKRTESGHFGHSIADGAYGSMIERITSRNNPHLFVMLHANWKVDWLQLIPNFLFVPGIIQKRSALGASARRSGWIGCNILIGDIPESGKISVVKNGQSRGADSVLEDFRSVRSLQTSRIEQRGWRLDVLKCVEEISSNEFSIEDVYSFADVLARKYPKNRFVKPKIRQQLQRLRDRGLLFFRGNGVYEKSEKIASFQLASNQ